MNGERAEQRQQHQSHASRRSSFAVGNRVCDVNQQAPSDVEGVDAPLIGQREPWFAPGDMSTLGASAERNGTHGPRCRQYR